MRYIKTIPQSLGRLSDELVKTGAWLCDIRVQVERRVDTGQSPSATTFVDTLREAEYWLDRLADLAAEVSDAWDELNERAADLDDAALEAVEADDQ